MSNKHDLPPLPERWDVWKENDDSCGAWARPDRDVYTAEQMRDYALAAIQRLEAEAQQVNEYARQLAIAIHAKYYPEVTQWKPLPDLMGVLTQIDNMTAGLVMPERLEADNQALKKGEGALDLDAAAKKLAECFDYPWAYMPEAGRAGMRRDALAVILAAMTKEQKT